MLKSRGHPPRSLPTTSQNAADPFTLATWEGRRHSGNLRCRYCSHQRFPYTRDLVSYAALSARNKNPWVSLARRPIRGTANCSALLNVSACVTIASSMPCPILLETDVTNNHRFTRWPARTEHSTREGKDRAFFLFLTAFLCFYSCVCAAAIVSIFQLAQFATPLQSSVLFVFTLVDNCGLLF